MRGLSSTMDCQRMPRPGQQQWVDALQHKASRDFSGNAHTDSLRVCMCHPHALPWINTAGVISA